VSWDQRLYAVHLYLFCSISPYLPSLLVVYVATVVVRAGLFITPEHTQIHRSLARVIDITQVADLAFSLLTNVIATSIIAVKTWYVDSASCGKFHIDSLADVTHAMRAPSADRKFRELMIRGDAGSRTSTPASQVMILLVESGLLYSIVGVSRVLDTQARVFILTVFS